MIRSPFSPEAKFYPIMMNGVGELSRFIATSHLHQEPKRGGVCWRVILRFESREVSSRLFVMLIPSRRDYRECLLQLVPRIVCYRR